MEKSYFSQIFKLRAVAYGFTHGLLTDTLTDSQIFKLRTEAYTFTLGHWLTDSQTHRLTDSRDSLTHSSVRIMLLKTCQRCKNHTLAKLIQGFRQQVTWPTLLGGINIEEYLANYNKKSKTIQLSTMITVMYLTSIYLCIYLSIYIFIYLFTCISIYLSIYICIYLFTCISIYLSI